MKLLFVVNDFGFFLSHRLEIGRRAAEMGYEVFVAAPGEPPSELAKCGLRSESITLSRRGANPFAELVTLAGFVNLFHRVEPDLVHLVTIKPVLYGGIAARIARVPAVVSSISGLGTVFSSDAVWAAFFRRLAKGMYRLALGHKNQRVILQNSDDREVLISGAGLHQKKTVLLRGSGVLLEQYPLRDETGSVPIVAFAARLLWSKGVGVFIDAARILAERGVKARFWLIGDPDPGNPSSVPIEDLENWRAEGLVEILGFRTDVPELYAQSHIVTLPSFYGEGLPKTLIEAAACGRVVVTTDMPGCRDAIEPNVSGLLVPPRNAVALADALERLIGNAALRQAMGRAGRALAEREFGIEEVVAAHLGIYRGLLNKCV